MEGAREYERGEDIPEVPHPGVEAFLTEFFKDAPMEKTPLQEKIIDREVQERLRNIVKRDARRQELMARKQEIAKALKKQGPLLPKDVEAVNAVVAEIMRSPNEAATNVDTAIVQLVENTAALEESIRKLSDDISDLWAEIDGAVREAADKN